MYRQTKEQRSRPGWLRGLALATAGSFAWTFVLAVPAQAITHLPAPKRQGVRTLATEELSKIFGAQTHVGPISPESGGTYPWEASVDGTNTGNGNKTTSIPIVGWSGRGGAGVSFAITHNSQSSHFAELGQKWTL